MTNLSNFKQIPGYEDLYLINKEGQIYSKKRNKLLSPCKNGNEYLNVGLCKNNKRKKFFIHRLIALTFIPNPDNLPCVNHKNGIKTDNRAENLEWCSYSDNMKHAYSHGLNENTRAASRKTGKLNAKHLDNNLKELFDDIFINKLKNKDICNKYNLKHTYVSNIKAQIFLKTALNEYFGGSK